MGAGGELIGGHSYTNQAKIAARSSSVPHAILLMPQGQEMHPHGCEKPSVKIDLAIYVKNAMFLEFNFHHRVYRQIRRG